MKIIQLESPQLTKGYDLPLEVFDTLLSRDAPFWEINKYIKYGTCLGQVLALGRAYLRAEDKENLDVDFFKSIHY